MQLSAHFYLHEFTDSQTASRRMIDNTPGAAEIAALRLLCEHILEPVRTHYNRPVRISSGYRSPELNRAIGGSSNTSQHMKGQAADFEVLGQSNPDVCFWIRDNLQFDQLILEFYTPGQISSGWVHCSYRMPVRRDVLTARRIIRNGRQSTQYLPGIVP
jgi:hypothetical protein